MYRSKMPDNPLSQNFSIFSLLQFAFPSIAMMIFMGSYTIVDTIFVSRFVNTNALSAINIVCPVVNFIVGFGTMLATGGNAIVAHKIGAKDSKKANEYFSLLILFGVASGIIISLLGTFFIKPLIWALGASKILFPYCRNYLFILLLFTPANILQVLFQNLIVTAGKPAFGLILSIAAGFSNIILDYIFMDIFQMGISGSALATGIGYSIPAFIGLLFFNSKKGLLFFTKPVIDFFVLFKICSNGSSEMISQLSTAITTFFFNLTMMKLCGESGVAAITIIIYSQFLLTALYIGFSIGTAPILSFHFGAKDTKKLKQIFKISYIIIISSSIGIFGLSILFKKQILVLFVSQNSSVYQLAYKGFQIFAYSFLFSGFNLFSSAFFTALSNGKISAILSFFRTLGFLMIGLLILPKLFGITGVWLSIPIAEFLTFLISIMFLKDFSLI